MAIDDQMEARFTCSDLDGDAEDSCNSIFQWKAGSNNIIASATTKTFTSIVAQLRLRPSIPLPVRIL
jgi:hypothetical protein